MILLIGGSSHTGKTYLAQKLVEKTGYKYMSLDKFRLELIEKKVKDLPIDDDYKMRYFLWPFATKVIKTAIENKENMIVDGCYIPGEWKTYFEDKYLSEIKSVFLVMSQNYIESNIKLIKDTANVAEQRINDIVDVNRLVMCSKNFKNDCIENNIPYIEISDKFDINALIYSCLNYLP